MAVRVILQRASTSQRGTEVTLPKPVQELIDNGKATPENFWAILAAWQVLFYAPEGKKLGRCGPAERRLRAKKRKDFIWGRMVIGLTKKNAIESWARQCP